jgi:hypothetical protein
MFLYPRERRRCWPYAECRIAIHIRADKTLRKPVTWLGDSLEAIREFPALARMRVVQSTAHGAAGYRARTQAVPGAGQRKEALMDNIFVIIGAVDYRITYYSEAVQAEILALPDTLAARYVVLSRRMVASGPKFGAESRRATHQGVW